MRIKVGSTRIDLEMVDGYRVENTPSDTVIRVFLSNGGYLCLSEKYENLTVEQMLGELDRAFFN
jgi:hypothetical protein